MSENLQVRALALREAGVKQKDVAERIGVSVKTIRRLEQKAKGVKPGEETWDWEEEVLWVQGGCSNQESLEEESEDNLHTASDPDAEDLGALVETSGEHHPDAGDREVLGLCYKAFLDRLTAREEVEVGNWASVLGKLSLEALLLCR